MVQYLTTGILAAAILALGAAEASAQNFISTGRGHGVIDKFHDLAPGQGSPTAFAGTAVEIDGNGNPFQGIATLWVSNIWPERVNNLFTRVHYRVHADWGNDINYKVNILFE